MEILSVVRVVNMKRVVILLGFFMHLANVW